MFERFTDRARKVMQLANQEAQRFNHEYIGTEHILLGLVKEGSGVAANVLKNLDVDLRKIRLEVERIVQPGEDKGEPLGRRPQTPRAKKAIEYAIEEARGLHHNYVGTEHLLLGLLREQEGIGAQVLMNLGLRLDDLRQEVLNLLGHNPAADGPGVVLHRIDKDLTAAGRSRYRGRARRAMRLANDEARRLHHEYVGTEHVLLGLTREGENAAVAALEALGIDPRAVRLEVERIIQPGAGGDRPVEGRRPHTPRVTKAIEYAVEEARNWGDDKIGCGHLLIGLVREGEGVAGYVLANLGATPERVREEVRKAPLETESADQTDGPAAALPAEFAALDAVIGRLNDLKEQAVAAQKFVEAAWFLDQVKQLRQVREAILHRFGNG